MQSNNKIKIIIISSLCIVAIILFYFFIKSDDKITNNINENQNLTSDLKNKIGKDIDSIIHTFGIKKEWIKDISIKEKDPKKKTDQLWLSKEILIPYDLATIDLNYEISNYLINKNLKEKVTEDPKTKNISINILSGGTTQLLVGNIKLNYSDAIKRDAAEICLIFDSLDSYLINDVENILNSTQEFSVLLPLRNDKAEYQSKIINAKRDYILKFMIGNEEDVTADFKSDMKESVWKSKVKSVALNFPKASAVILNSKNGLNEFENEVREEFFKNNLNVYKDTLFMQYKPNEQKVNSLFEDIISKSNKGKKYLFYVVNFSADNFNSYDKKVYALKKLGYKFYSFKDIVKRMNKKFEIENSELKNQK